MKKKSVKGIAALFICLGGVPSQTTARAGRIVRAGSATAKPLFLCILCLTTIWRLPLVSQEPTRPEMTPGLSRSRYSLVTPTIAKARVADTEKGAEAYAADLTDFVVSDRPGKSYVKKFSRRLANADLAARRSGQGWVAESAVAQAFNDLMEQAAPSPSPADQDRCLCRASVAFFALQHFSRSEFRYFASGRMSAERGHVRDRTFNVEQRHRRQTASRAPLTTAPI